MPEEKAQPQQPLYYPPPPQQPPPAGVNPAGASAGAPAPAGPSSLVQHSSFLNHKF